MSDNDVMHLAVQAMALGAKLAGPILIISLVIGFAISLLQSVTQVQEMTLANVPKIFVTLLATMLFLPFGFAAMRSFMEQILQLVVGV